jgi:hypothetical protein
MQPIDSNQPNIEMRYRTLLILWFAICMSVLMFLVLIRFVTVEVSGNQMLSLALNCLGVVPMGISFLLKQRILNQAVEAQRLDLVQVGYVVAYALCEAAALLGLMSHFLFGSSYYYLGFMFAGLGMLLHFPQKRYLLDASRQQF